MSFQKIVFDLPSSGGNDQRSISGSLRRDPQHGEKRGRPYQGHGSGGSGGGRWSSSKPAQSQDGQQIQNRLGARAPREPLPASLRTYIISGASGLNHQPLRDLLNGDGWTEVTTATKEVGFMSLEQGWRDPETGWSYDKSTYDIRCRIKSLLTNTKKAITNKQSLYVNMARQNPAVTRAHMAQTWESRDVREVRPDEPLIVRPVGPGASSGIGVTVVNSVSGLRAVERELSSKFQSVIASVYIRNPMLWEGRKFHCRMYFLVCVGPGGHFATHLWNEGKILVAKTEYKDADYGNKDIHDTHADSTPRNLWFPSDLPAGAQPETLLRHMRTVLDSVGEIMRTRAEAYPESDYAFQVFGCDFLPTEDNNIFLLEINNKVGFEPCGVDESWNAEVGPWTDDYTEFSRKYYTWIYESAIKPLFHAQEKIETSGQDEPQEAKKRLRDE